MQSRHHKQPLVLIRTGVSHLLDMLQPDTPPMQDAVRHISANIPSFEVRALEVP